MNTDLLRDVRDHIATEPEHFDMAWWIGRRAGALPANTAIPFAEVCGTTACIAGWAMTLAGGYFLQTDVTGSAWTAAYIGPDGGEVLASAEGARLLGLTLRQASRLFGTDGWPEHYQAMTREETEAKAAISLLDDILDGLTVWGEARGWVYLPDDVVADDEVSA